jgi:hypothetical protein
MAFTSSDSVGWCTCINELVKGIPNSTSIGIPNILLSYINDTLFDVNLHTVHNASFNIGIPNIISLINRVHLD